MLVPPASREASYKLAPRVVPGKLLAVIGHNTYSVYLGNRKVVQTCFIKLFENPQQHLGVPVRPLESLEVPGTSEGPQVSEKPEEVLVPERPEAPVRLPEGVPISTPEPVTRVPPEPVTTATTPPEPVNTAPSPPKPTPVQIEVRLPQATRA